VELAVKLHLVEHLAAVALHAAVVVVQLDAGERTDEPVEHPARPDLVERVVADFLPPADHVKPLFDARQETGDLPRVVLQVRVERHHEPAARRVKPRAQRRGLPEIPPEPQPPHAGVGLGDLADLLPRRIGRAVVDEDDVEVIPAEPRHLVQLGVELRQALVLVERGDDDRQHAPGEIGR
jgi:hypothetical protein